MVWPWAYIVVKYIFSSSAFPSLLESCLLAIDARRPFHRLLHDEKISARHRWKDQFLSCMEIRHDVVFFAALIVSLEYFVFISSSPHLISWQMRSDN